MSFDSLAIGPSHTPPGVIPQAPQWNFEPIPLAHPRRVEIEGFIRQCYAETYGAQLQSLAPCLLALPAGEQLKAAVGLRRASEGRLFVEHYVDAPLERAAMLAAGAEIQRETLVEISSFAAYHPGDARAVIVALTCGLYAMGFRWVTLVATRALRNAFARLGLAPVSLGQAQRSRVLDDGTDWGSYYDTAPELLIGDIDAGMRYLVARGVVAPVDGGLGR